MRRKPRGSDPAEAAAARARAQELLMRARAAIDSGKAAEGRGLLKQAVEVDARLWAAYEKLADLAEQSGSDDQRLEAYRLWADAGPATPLPFNRMGEILERRKDYKAALEAYTASLKVEWNQPPALEAKSRLERLAGP